MKIAEEKDKVYYKVNGRRFEERLTAERYAKTIVNSMSSKVWVSVIIDIKEMPCVIKSYTIS